MNEQNLTKLEQLLKLLDENVKKEDFDKAIEGILRIVVRQEEIIAKALEKLQETYGTAVNRVHSEHSSAYRDLRKQVNEAFVGETISKMKDEHGERMKTIDEKLKTIKNGKDGHTPIKGKDYFDGTNGIDGNKIRAGEVRDKLETLKGEDRLDKSAIKGLEEELKGIKKGVSGASTYGISGGAKGRVHYYDLTPQCNGVLKTFAVPLNFGIIGVFSTQAPINYRPMVDWTVGNRQLLLTSQVDAPQSGQTLWIAYIR